ncbi:MAG: hypothetical protein E7271_09550 [Lachnospiraceae bacterium]|nr:hypothetical protein [Lachnospiraceae bacterium]
MIDRKERGGEMTMVNEYTNLDNDQARYEEYEELLVRRDQLFKEAGSYMTGYTAEFGDLITANFELKIECIKKKKAISYCRRRINRGLGIDGNSMQAELDKEMNLYYVQLKGMIDDTENAKNAEKVGEYRYSRAKKIYRRLAKRLHPDINKKTNDNDILKEYWNRIVVAYHKSDIEELEDLEVLVRNTMEELGDVGFEIDYSDIEKRIERVERQINDIINTEPYIYGEILNSEERKEELKNNLQEEHDDYEQYLDTLSKSLDDMLREGGVEVIWKMN